MHAHHISLGLGHGFGSIPQALGEYYRNTFVCLNIYKKVFINKHKTFFSLINISYISGL